MIEAGIECSRALLSISRLQSVKGKSETRLQFLLGHDFDTDLLLSLPGPVVEYLLPVGTLLCIGCHLLVCRDGCVATLRSNLTLAHLEIFPDHHYQLHLLYGKCGLKYLISDSLSTIGILSLKLSLFSLLLLLILATSTTLPVEREVPLEGERKDDSESEPEEG